ncbi:MAG TPA: EAL domain-containing protein [Sphingobium sp.]|nr:EAL domain-containing protein [Sphingobium sp.]
MLLNLFSVRTSDEELAKAVRVALLKALFASRASLVMGAFSGVVITSAVVYFCPSPWLIAAGALLVLTGIGRIASFGLFQPGSADAGTIKWEIIYQFGALAYAAMLGLVTFLTILISDDLRLHLLTAATSTGYAAAAAARNTGRPGVAIGQLLICALPLSIALLIQASVPSIVLAIVNLLYITVMVDITLRTYKTVLDAFIDRQEKLRLATVYERLSRTDPLTGIDNRTTLKRNLEELLDRRDGQIAVIWLDLDRFKQINDTLGHNSGDEILQSVASRLANLAYPSGKLARFGGDEFIIVTPVKDSQDAMALGDRVRFSLTEPVELENGPVDISASIGLSISNEYSTADELLRHADVALYEAKAHGRNCVQLFDPEMERRLLNSKQIEHDLRRAIMNEELEVYFQPVVDLKTLRVKSFEALLRWHHPVNGSVPPSLFIPIAEASNSIGAITEWVLMQACKEAAKWPNGLSVAVNMSPALLNMRSLPTLVSETLLRTGLPPRRLNLEITETALVEDNPETKIVLESLKNLGVSLSLDDFGTGYSSLSHLCRYRFDAIKIDRSFLANVHQHSESRAVIQAISSLATSLELTVVAEGIETFDQLMYIYDHGCAAGQGYYFAKPMPGRDVPGYLERAERERAALAASLSGREDLDVERSGPGRMVA